MVRSQKPNIDEFDETVKTWEVILLYMDKAVAYQQLMNTF